MRPDVAAFRELDTLVRNLTDQLAGYRRRALAGEARTRDLEAQVAQLKSALEESARVVAAANESREHALAAAREATAAARTAREALAELERSAAADSLAAASGTVAPAVMSAGGGDAATLAENARLRARLDEARERTAQLADRVRFLRQQLVHGVEK